MLGTRNRLDKKVHRLEGRQADEQVVELPREQNQRGILMHNKCWVTINWSETMEVVGAMCSKLCSQASTIVLLAYIPGELRRSHGKKVAKGSRTRTVACLVAWRQRYCLLRDIT